MLRKIFSPENERIFFVKIDMNHSVKTVETIVDSFLFFILLYYMSI